MLNIKKIDIYVTRQFTALLVVTFFITLFVIVMQFVWLRIDDMIGKGIPFDVMGKFFFYAALSSAPIALPLAIQLAALMTFGNMGERLELIAMKTAGISLFRIMRSLIVFVSAIAIGSFFYSNYVIPIAQQRMWTLMFSFQDKALEIEIPIGEFYSGIRGVNIYARGKDKKENALLNVMMYDFSKGFDNASITSADTVKIVATEDKKYIKIVMHNGESFENVQSRQVGSTNIPYRRETFRYKELLFEFDTGFKEMDETVMANQHISKNILKLTSDIDSINIKRDSLKTKFSKWLITNNNRTVASGNNTDINLALESPTVSPIKPSKPNVESIETVMASATQAELEAIAKNALQRVDNGMSDVRYNAIIISDSDSFFISHNIEWHLKFTLSFACIIFFFIGAPLGSIIGKGGIGLPTVVSIILFIIYYIINTMAQKLAREGSWEVWQGMWFSALILLPIGIFLTYKAVKDTMMFDTGTYKQMFARLKGVFSKKNRT